MVWFIPQIEKIVSWVIPQKTEEEVYRLKYIQGGPLSTAELSIDEARQEIIHFGEICSRETGFIRDAVKAKNNDELQEPREKLIKYEGITDKIEYVGADNPYIAGFFHSRELSEQYNYKCAIKETFGNRYIDVETILKTPVLSQNSDMIVSSIAFDMLKLKPTSDDILMIAHDEYPSYIMQDDTHFNENGYKLAAKIILKEAVNHVV